MDYEIRYSNGKRLTVYDSEEDDFYSVIEADYPDAEYGDWEQVSLDGKLERMLVWENEEDSEDDDGSNAVASVHRQLE